MTKVTFGKYGEDLACHYLQKQGYKILERNFRIRGGEIDIIALEDKTLVYVEVKTRTSHQFGYPEEAVTPFKLRFLKKAAKFYRNARRNLPELERIDVVAVDLIDSQNPQIRLIKNAAP